MKRSDISENDPHFIGCWNLENDLLCDEVIDFFNSHQESQEAGQSAGGMDTNAKKSTDITVHPRDLELPDYQAVKNYIDALYDCYKDYLQQYPFLNSILPQVNIGSFNIQRYQPGGHFKLEHTERTSLINSFRVLVWMTYLNDVEDGGSTTFTHQGIEVQPEKGKTLIWPAEWTHAHLGNILNSGSKFIITGWMHFPANS